MRHPVDDLTAYLDDALAPAERAALEAHLAGCAGCREERDRLAAAIALLATLPPAPAPSPLFETRFAARLAAETAARRARGAWLRRPVLRWATLGFAGAAAAVLVTSHQLAVRREDDLARHLDLLRDYEVVSSLGAVENAEDAEVVTHLDELGVKP